MTRFRGHTGAKVSSARGVGLVALLTVALGGACGTPAAPERSAVAPLALGPATPARPVAPPKPEAAPRAPDDLALLVRINDAEQLMREVVSILPPSAAAAAAILDPNRLLVLLLGERLGSVVDLAQPMDLASLGSNTPSFVVSMAVKQDAEAKLGEGLVLREEGNLLHIGKPADAYGAAARLNACAFTPAVGRAPTRLVCATDEASLKAGAPYLARNVAAEPLDADARFTLPGKTLREKHDGAAKAVSEAAGAKLGNDLVETFLEEIERVDADLRFSGSDLEVGLDLRLSARESMLARAIVPRSQPAAPPDAFYRLPGDAIVALHTTGALPADIAPLRKAIAENIEATLVLDGYKAEKTRVLREQIEALLLTGGPLVLGAGVAGGRDGADKALAALDGGTAGPTKPADEARAEAQARSALAPWVMIEVDEPAEKWMQGLRDIVRRAEDADKTRTPGSRSSTPRDPDGDHVDLKIGTVAPALQLPKDALHLEVLLVPRTKGKRPMRKAHLLVVPKAATTWIGYSDDLAAIAARLRLALDDATEVGTLAKSADATSLRARPALGAGLVSLGGFGHLTAKTRTAEELRSAARSASRLAGLGVRGEIVTWTASASALPGSGPGATKLSIHAQAKRQTAVDVLRMLGL